MKEIKYGTQFYTASARTFVIPFYYGFGSGSGSGTVLKYGSGSGSDFLACYGSGSASQKVTVPAVPALVPRSGSTTLQTQVLRVPWCALCRYESDQASSAS
jgi:hypothetical protein